MPIFSPSFQIKCLLCFFHCQHALGRSLPVTLSWPTCCRFLISVTGHEEGNGRWVHCFKCQSKQPGASSSIAEVPSQCITVLVKSVEDKFPPMTPPLDATVWILAILHVWKRANQTEVLTPCTKVSWLWSPSQQNNLKGEDNLHFYPYNNLCNWHLNSFLFSRFPF